MKKKDDPPPIPTVTLTATTRSAPVAVGPLSLERARFDQGTRVGEFEIERAHAEGGFSVIYRAHRVDDGSAVAVKLMRRRLAESEVALRRFEREARVLNELRHPNIVRVLAAGAIEDGRPYIAMEWIEGSDLRKELERRGVFDVGEAIALIAEIGSALSLAHERGIVHRDIKASNVMVTPQAGWLHTTLIDFGIAKLLAGERTGPRDPTLTATNETLGTPHSMAPEQIMRQPVDVRTDIYALGLLLYSMVTGRAAFAADTLAEVEEQQLHAKPPRPSAISPVPPRFDDVVLRCLEKEPARRFPSLPELLAALRACTAPATPVKVSVRARIDDGLGQIDDAAAADAFDALELVADAAAEEGARVLVHGAGTLLLEAPNARAADNLARRLERVAADRPGRSPHVEVVVDVVGEGAAKP